MLPSLTGPKAPFKRAAVFRFENVPVPVSQLICCSTCQIAVRRGPPRRLSPRKPRLEFDESTELRLPAFVPFAVTMPCVDVDAGRIPLSEARVDTSLPTSVAPVLLEVAS